MRTRCRLFTLNASFLICTAAAVAQTAPVGPTFDVASVRLSTPLDMAKLQAEMRAGKMPNFGPHIDAVRAQYIYMSLTELIGMAYGVKRFQITGPDWLPAQHFDIVATLPQGASKDDVPKMLQVLLEERFKLKVHRDSQEHPVLALVVGKGGPKMKEAASAPEPFDETAPLKPDERKIDTVDGQMRLTIHTDGSSTVNMGAKGTFTQKADMGSQTLHLNSDAVTMTGFADMLTRILQLGGRQVVDMTGLKGNYAVALDISIPELMAMAKASGMDVGMGAGPGGGGGAAAGEASDPGGGGATIFASVEKLGLKLESRKAPVEQLVVDAVEKTPTEN